MRLLTVVSIALFIFVSPLSAQVIDDTPTRVQTTLDPGLNRLGTLRPKNVSEISTSRWTIGCETIDRQFTDYATYKEYLAPLGIKRIRLQGGWARTEKWKGVYDFAWLDYIIDDARSRGLEILLETSYGNPHYSDGGGATLGANFPRSEEALAAWDLWVEAMATRYKDKVKDWSMWNEPDHMAPEEIAAFNIRTSEIIKRVIPDARIAGLVWAWPDPKKIEPALKYIAEKGKADLFYWIVYHAYTANPDASQWPVPKVRELVQKYTPHLKLWQGESGTQSEFCLDGAISKRPWTELTQAKWDTRRMLGDIGNDADSLVFSFADINKRHKNLHSDMLRYGLVKTAGAEQGYKVLKVKIAYYAVQNVVSVFNDSIELVSELTSIERPKGEKEKRTASFLHKHKETGTSICVFWDKSGTPSDFNVHDFATVTLEGVRFEEPVWVDVVTGNVYEFPKDRMKIVKNKLVIENVPVYDAPTFIAEKRIIDYSVYPPTVAK